MKIVIVNTAAFTHLIFSCVMTPTIFSAYTAEANILAIAARTCTTDVVVCVLVGSYILQDTVAAMEV